MIHKAYSRTPKKRVSNLLLLATVFCTPAGSTSPYASIHALQLAMESAPSSCMVPGNPAGAATAGEMIGATRTSEKRCAEPLKALASAIMIRRSIPSKRAVIGNKALGKPRWGDFVSRKAMDDLNKINIKWLNNQHITSISKKNNNNNK